jgi:hypothetical protein
VAAAISATTITATLATGPHSSDTSDDKLRPQAGSGRTHGAAQIGGTEGTTGGTEGTFGGSTGAKKDEKEDKNKTDIDTAPNKQADKPAAKKLAMCS